MIIDLHIHSDKSDDGEYSPKELVAMAKNINISYIAITDHNCVEGINEAIEYKDESINIIPAIEIDCVFEGINLHLLGYYIDYKQKDYETLYDYIKHEEIRASLERIENIKKLGFDIEKNEVMNMAKDKIVTGELIAEVLLKKDYTNSSLNPYREGGKRSDNPYVNFYHDYFSQGKEAYAHIEYMKLQDAIMLIKDTGGVSVLAHPYNNIKDNIPMLDKIIKQKVDGIEAFSSYHSDKEKKLFFEYAKEKNIIPTAGSDFHGKTKPSVKIGTEISSFINSANIIKDMEKRLL